MKTTRNSIRTKLQEMADYAYLQKDSLTGVGLINGKMGLCINLYHISRYLNNHDLMTKADNLLDEIYAQLSLSLSIYLSNGLTGVAWGLLHLESESFVKGDIETVLLDIDILEIEFAKYFPIKEYGFLTGFMGQMIYVINRIENCKDSDNIMILQLQVLLISLIEQLDHIVTNEDALYVHPSQATVYWDLLFAASILSKLEELNIYKSRVTKIRTTFIEKIEHINISHNLYGLMLDYIYLLSKSNFSIVNRIYERPSKRTENILCDLSLLEFLHKFSEQNLHYEKAFQEEKEEFFLRMLSSPSQCYMPALSDGYKGFYRILKFV